MMPMLARVVLFALMAIGLVGFGTVAWVSLRPPTVTASVEAPTQKTTREILVAARQLRAGTLLKPEDLAAERRAAADVPAGARSDIQAARDELLGAMVRRNLARGDPVLPGDALNPGDRGFLAAVLGPGMRAVTVGVDAVSGLAGLVWPGDRVDLILTQSQEGSAIPAARRVSSETVLQDVRVIAIDRQMVQGATSESPESQAARTVTLEVTPSDAERVTVAARLGHLSLAVVAVARTAEVPANADHQAEAPSQARQGITWGGDVSSALRGGSSSDGARVLLFQGPSEGKELRFP